MKQLLCNIQRSNQISLYVSVSTDSTVYKMKYIFFKFLFSISCSPIENLLMKTIFNEGPMRQVNLKMRS
jgi:hypothetical protein